VSEDEPTIRVILLLENGTYRELLATDEKGQPALLKLTAVQAEAFSEAITKLDLDYIHETGLDDISMPFGPQLALTERGDSQFWISSDPGSQGGTLRVVEAQLRDLR